MKYTFQILLGGSDYLDLYPNSDVEMTGGWETGTMIWREKISELKITKTKNSAIYDTLEAWFEDKDYFETRIFVKVLKNNVQDSLHWFGVKWGKLNKHLCTYTVEPNVYDIWGHYFEAGKDVPVSTVSGGGFGYTWFVFDSSYEYLRSETPRLLKFLIKGMVNSASCSEEWPEADVVSSFLWQDNYEDTSAVGTVRGMPLDYVTGIESYIAGAGLIVDAVASLTDMMQWLTMFRAFPFIDSNDKFRIEHISFFNEKFIDNAVDFSSYINDSHEVWEYENTNIPVLEKISFNKAEEPTTIDFKDIAITYSDIRNRSDSPAIDISSQIYTDIAALGTEDASDLTLFSGFVNFVYMFTDIDMEFITVAKNYFEIEWNVEDGYTKMGSNDMVIEYADTYTFTANITSISGTFAASLVDRSSSAVISNVIQVSTTGVTSGTFTATAAANDAYLLIEGIAPPLVISGNAEGWITLTEEGTIHRYMVPVVDGYISENPQTNGAFSTANIVNDYWKDDRVAKSGTFNGVVTAFDSIFNLRRDTIKIHYAGVIQPLFGFNDGTRIGKIDKWTRMLDTDFYEIDVIYQEDE